MNYHVTVYTNEMLVEVRIATDPHPGAGFISARKFLYSIKSGSPSMLPSATVRIEAGLSGDLSLDEIDHLQCWLTEAAKMARLLDRYVTGPADFESGTTYEVRQVAGTLILDKIEPVYQQKPVEEVRR